jgi:CheY-like chemotaxis protein
MYSASPPVPHAERLVTLLTLVAGNEQAAQEIAFALDGERGTKRTLDDCRDGLLGAALGQALSRGSEASALPGSERLALVLARATDLSDEQAAAAAGLSLQAFRSALQRAEEALSASPNRRAVILEDHLLSRETLSEQCAALGLDVVAATGEGAAALAAAAAFVPAIALVDLTLDGAELAGDLSAMQIREAAPECHVMFVTGYEDAPRIASLMQNASALVKPVGQEELAAAVRAALPHI